MPIVRCRPVVVLQVAEIQEMVQSHFQLIDCPNRSMHNDGIAFCQIIDTFVHVDSVCVKCVNQWIHGVPPDKTNIPKVITDLVILSTPTNKRPVNVNDIAEKERSASLYHELKTATTALVQFVKSGGQLLSKEDTKARLDICETCPHRSSHLLGYRCYACGCFLKVKAKLPNEHCPLRKWPNDPPNKPCGCGK